MKKFFALSATALIIGCAAGEPDASMDDAAHEAEEAMPEMAMLTLDQIAGSWTMQVLNAAGDSTLIESVMTGTADPASWTMTFPGRDPIPMMVSIEGDSMMFHVGPYASALRDDVMVTTEGTSRLENGMLMGTFTAHYTVPTADSLLVGRLAGTTMP
jgi:hypothetical protein